MSVTTGGRRILIHGLALVLFGLLWGLAIPHTPYPRLALSAHTQFETNGLLFVVLAVLLLALPHAAGSKSVWVMELAAWLTWAMALSEVANSWWGTNQLLRIVASQGGAMGGAPWQEAVVTITHIVAGIGLIIAWTLLLIGFAKTPRGATAG